MSWRVLMDIFGQVERDKNEKVNEKRVNEKRVNEFPYDRLITGKTNELYTSTDTTFNSKKVAQ